MLWSDEEHNPRRPNESRDAYDVRLIQDRREEAAEILGAQIDRARQASPNDAYYLLISDLFDLVDDLLQRK